MRRILPLFIVLLLLFGCVSEKPYSSQKSESELSSDILDPNGDSIADFYYYTFSKVKTDGYSIQREVYVFPEQSAGSTSFKSLSDEELSALLTAFISFEEEKRAAVDSCFESMGLKGGCVDYASCNHFCSEYSPECKEISEKYYDYLGYSILELYKIKTSLVDLTNSINNRLYMYESLTLTQKADLINDLNSFYLESVKAMGSPLYTDPELQLCSNPSTSFSQWNVIKSGIASYTLQADSYGYLVILKLEREAEKENNYIDLFVKDNSPTGAFSINSPQEITSEGGWVNWPIIKPYTSSSILFYYFSSADSPESISWKTPSVKTRELDLSFLGISFFVFNSFYPISNYYIALGLAIAIPLLLLSLLVNLVLLAYNLLSVKIKKESNYKAIKSFVGVPNTEWKKDILFGAIITAIGFGATFFAEHITENKLVVFKVPDYIFGDYAGFIGIFCLIVGLGFIFFAVLASIKLSMLKGSYQGVIRVEKETVKVDITHLKEKLATLRALIKELQQDGLEVTEAYEVYTSIPLAKLEKEASRKTEEGEEVEGELKELENNINKVDSMVSMLKERKESAESEWPKWNEKLKEILADKEGVYLSNLTFIPVPLRRWTVNKFIKENTEMSLALEGEVLKKTKTDPMILINKMVEDGLIQNALVYKDGKEVVSVIRKGNKTMYSVLTMKLLSYLKTFLDKFGKKEYKYVMGIGNNTVFAIINKGGKESLILADREKFKDAFEKWKDVLNKI